MDRLMGEQKFYCPVYEGKISEYDCSEISTGIKMGHFIDDGLPFLMELGTAIARKNRCFACPRCPEHYRPPGLSSAQSLWHLGFPETTAELEAALSLLAKIPGYTVTRIGEGIVREYQLPCGVQILQQWDTQLGMPHDTQAQFFTTNAVYLRLKHLIRYQEPGKLVRSAFTASLSSRIRGRYAFAGTPLHSANMSEFREEWLLKDSRVAQITAFPTSLACYENIEAYRSIHERDMGIAEASPPAGSVKDASAHPGEDVALSGVVMEAEVIINDLTGLPFYHMTLNCRGLRLDVVAATTLFENHPERGNVLQGRFYLSARILHYEYTGYEFEIDVTTPLTAARFAPLALAISNIQPSEHLYCGIDPPLGDITFVRVKGEVEGYSVEFRLVFPEEDTTGEVADADEGAVSPEAPGETDGQSGNDEEAQSDGNFQILRFYPVSKEMAVRIFEQTLVYHNPPYLGDAKDVTQEYP